MVYIKMLKDSPFLACMDLDTAEKETIDPVFIWIGPNGMILKRQSNMNLTQTGKLMLKTFTISMSGLYSCTLSYKSINSDFTQEKETFMTYEFVVLAYHEPDYVYQIDLRYMAMPCNNLINDRFVMTLLEIIKEVITGLNCDLQSMFHKCHFIKAPKHSMQNELFISFKADSVRGTYKYPVVKYWAFPSLSISSSTQGIGQRSNFDTSFNFLKSLQKRNNQSGLVQSSDFIEPDIGGDSRWAVVFKCLAPPWVHLAPVLSLNGHSVLTISRDMTKEECSVNPFVSGWDKECFRNPDDCQQETNIRLEKARKLIVEFFKMQTGVLKEEFVNTPEIYYMEHSLDIIRVDSCRLGFGKNKVTHHDCLGCCES
ncbi:zona pellucida-binding protein 2 [Dendrobates tinctorius]|uniref:zona pellucida-binding protein 2 n=1 Tax=Dendrobates tinctorius TaxID=92724 RepID=UPI003CC99EC6